MEREPFRTAYEYLQQTLNHTALCVVIGFSFRDPAVNETLRSALNENGRLRLIIVEPSMNQGSGVKFEDVLGKLGVDEPLWNEKIQVILGKFGGDSWVHKELAYTIDHIDEWTELEHWITETNATADTKH